MGLLADAPRPRVYLDANLFIYFAEGHPDLSELVRHVLSAVDDGLMTAATSELTVAEVLVRPIRERATRQADYYRRLITDGPGLSVLPVTRAVLEEGARVRAVYGIRLPDAIQVATAALSGCDVFLTNDRELLRVSAVPVCLLSDWSPPCT